MSSPQFVVYSKASSWRLLYCSLENRIVTLRSAAPMTIVPLGEYSEKLFLTRDHDTVAFVSVGPHRLVLSKTLSLEFADGVPLSGELIIEFRVRSDDASLGRVAARGEAEFQMFLDRIHRAARATTASYGHGAIETLRLEGPAGILNHWRTVDSEAAGPLELIAAHCHGLEIGDSALRKSALERHKLEDSASFDKRRAEISAQRAEFDAALKTLAAKQKVEIERLNSDHSLEVDRLRAQQKLDVQTKKAELLKTESGQMSEDMAAVFSFKGKQLEVEKALAQLNDKQKRDLLQALLSHQSGQNSVLRAFAANQLGIHLTEETAAADSVRKISSESASDIAPTESEAT